MCNIPLTYSFVNFHDNDNDNDNDNHICNYNDVILKKPYSKYDDMMIRSNSILSYNNEKQDKIDDVVDYVFAYYTIDAGITLFEEVLNNK